MALTLLACGGGGGGGAGGDSGSQPETAFGGPAAALTAIVDSINESNTAETAVMRVSLRNIPDNAVRATCLFQLEDGNKYASYGSGMDYQFVDNDGPVVSAAGSANTDADSMEINCGRWDDVSGTAASRSPDISIRVRWDADDEGEETIQITLKEVTFYDSADGPLARAKILSATATVIIDDEPPTPVKSFTADRFAITEEGGVATLTLTLDRAVPADGAALRFPYTIDGLNGADITASDIIPASLTGAIVIPAGSNTETITITARADTLDEGEGETMMIQLDAPFDTTGEDPFMTSSLDPVLITITDDDGSTGIPPVSVAHLDATPNHITENGGEATLTLMLDIKIPRGDADLVFPYAVDGVDGADITADDITAPDLTGGSITVSAGSDRGTATITALDDDLVEGDETMRITLMPLPKNARGATITADGIDPVQITITDDDAAADVPPAADAPPVSGDTDVPPAVERFTLSPEDITLTRRPLSEGGVDTEGGGRIGIDVRLTKAAVEDVKLIIRIEPDAGAYMCMGVGTADRLACTATAVETDFTIAEGLSQLTHEFLFNAADTGFTGLDDPETLTFSLSFPDGNVSTDNADLVRSIAVNYPAPTTICDNVILPTYTGTNSVSFTTDDVRETLTPGPATLERDATLGEGSAFFHVYRIVLAGTGRLTAKTTGDRDMEALLLEAPAPAPAPDRTLCEGLNLVVSGTNYESDIDFDGGDYNFRFEDDLSAGTYYLVVNDYEFRSGDYGLQITFIPAGNAGGSADAATFAGQQQRLAARVRALTLSTAEQQTGMIRDLVRRRTGGGAPDGITLNAPPDEGGMEELADLARSSLSVQQSVRGEDGGRYSLWASSAGVAGAHAGFEWASADGRNIHGVAMSLSSPALAFAAAGAGLADSAGWTWPGAWNEDMVLLAPYLGRRTAAMEIWATSGFGLGEISLDGGTADAAADSRIMFLQTGAAWRKAAPSGPRIELTVQGVAVRKDVSGFRLGDYAVPSVAAGIFRVSAATSLSWPLPLAGGIMRPGVAADVSGDFADVLPGRVRRNAGWTLSLSWTRGMVTAAVEGSGESGDAGFSRRGLGGDLGGSLRVSPARGLDLGVELRRRVAFGRDDVGGGHTARFTLRQTF